LDCFYRDRRSSFLIAASSRLALVIALLIPGAAQSNARFFGMSNWVNGGSSLDTQPYPQLGRRGTQPVAPGIIRSWDTYTGWADLAVSRGHYNWSQLDKLMDKADSHGASLLYVFGLIPDWAAGGTNSSGCHRNKNCHPPVDLNLVAECRGSMAGIRTTDCRLKEFVRDLLLHARTHVDPANGHTTPIQFVELGNETNAKSEWRGTAAEYARFSRDIAQIARSIDKSIYVISPGVNELDNGVCGPKKNGRGVCWLQEWLASGGNNGLSFIDAIGFHGYVDFGISSGTVTLRRGSRDVTFNGVDWDPDVWTGGTLSVYGKFANTVENISFGGHTAQLALPWAGPDWRGGYVLKTIRAENIDTVIRNLRSFADHNGASGKPLWDTENSWCGKACPFNGVNIAAVENKGDRLALTTFAPHAFVHAERIMIHGQAAEIISGSSEALAQVEEEGRDQSDHTRIMLRHTKAGRVSMRAPAQAVWIAFPYARQSEYLARKLLIEFSRGVAGNIWYAYSGAQSADNPQYGTLCDLPDAASTTCMLRPAGEAWGEVYKWLVDRRPAGSCSADGMIWRCDFVGTNGRGGAIAVWNSSALNNDVSFPVPGAFNEARDLLGGVRPVRANNIVIDGSPVLLETSSQLP
jgi:hypothetical protein